MATCAQPGEDWTVVLRRHRPASWRVGQRATAPTCMRSSAATAVNHPGLDYREVSPRLQLVRGSHPIAVGVAIPVLTVASASKSDRTRT
jgi:uncharacterized membrane protein